MKFKLRNKIVEINGRTEIFSNGHVYWIFLCNEYTPLTKKIVDNLILEFDKYITGSFGSKFRRFKVVGFKI